VTCKAKVNYLIYRMQIFEDIFYHIKSQGGAFSKQQVEDNFLKALHTKRVIM